MEQAQESEKDWVLRLQQGEDSAWNKLIGTYGEQLWRVICRTGRFRPGQDHCVEDIRQEAYFAATKSIHFFKGECLLSTWLCRLAIHKTLDHLRKEKRHVKGRQEPSGLEEENDPIQQIPDDGSKDPRNALIRKEDKVKMRKCLDLLLDQNENFWMVVNMYHFVDISYEEIAGALELSMNTVKSRLSRAREALKSCLQGNKTAFEDDRMDVTHEK